MNHLDGGFDMWYQLYWNSAGQLSYISNFVTWAKQWPCDWSLYWVRAYLKSTQYSGRGNMDMLHETRDLFVL